MSVNVEYVLIMSSPEKRLYRSIVQAAYDKPYLRLLLPQPLVAVTSMTRANEEVSHTFFCDQHFY